MDPTTEIPISQKFDLLESLTLRQKSIARLSDRRLAPEVYADIGTVYGLDPVKCTSADSLATEAAETLFNPIGNVMYENRARHELLEQIIEKAINGGSDLAILDTDMNNLKGLNDRLGEPEANKAIRAYVDDIKSSLISRIQAEGKEIYFAIINKWGQGSDSIKVILIGKDIYKFTRVFADIQAVKTITLDLRNKVSQESEKVDINGEWGFFVATNSNISSLQDSELSPLQNAGELYTLVSKVAEVKMGAEKSRPEAVMINKILDTTDLETLDPLWDEINRTWARVPVEVNIVMVQRQRALKKPING